MYNDTLSWSIRRHLCPESELTSNDSLLLRISGFYFSNPNCTGMELNNKLYEGEKYFFWRWVCLMLKHRLAEELKHLTNTISPSASLPLLQPDCPQAHQHGWYNMIGCGMMISGIDNDQSDTCQSKWCLAHFSRFLSVGSGLKFELDVAVHL